jgi:DNA-binding transcriptional LysR family regulator
MSGWSGIEECVAVADTGSFVAAARRLKSSTSHVSRAVAELEGRVHASLFFRTTRRVTLTDTGRALVERFRRMIAERDEALALAGGGGEVHGELRMTCSTAMGERFIAPIVRRYVEENPALTVQLDLTNRIVDLVAEGYDLAVRTGSLPDSSMVGTRIASRRLHVCASPAYLARHGTPANVANLDAHACLIGTAATWHFNVEGTDHVYRPRGRFQCNSGGTIADAALAGMGICQLPDFYVLPHVATGRLTLLLENLRRDDEPIWAVYPERRHLMPKVRDLVERLRQELGISLVAADRSSSMDHS